MGMNRSGQATVEYIILLVIIVGMYLIVLKGVQDWNFASRVSGLFTESYARSYQYGRPDVKGLDESGGPDKHPRAFVPERNNFRIFITPRKF